MEWCDILFPEPQKYGEPKGPNMTSHKTNATRSATITITTKQVGDGGEYLVAGLLTLGGTPTTKMLENQRNFDTANMPAGRNTSQVRAGGGSATDISRAS